MLCLNLCCGPNLFPGWRNLDKVDQSSYTECLRDAEGTETWPDHQRPLVEHIKAGRITSEVHDVRQGLPQFEDCSVDAIYLGQCIEHFNRGTEVPRLLSDCFRVLKPGGRIRITTPDLQLLMDVALANRLGDFASEQPAFFAGALPEDQLSYLMFGAMGPNCTTENYEGHFHLYSERSLRALLEATGFSEPLGPRGKDIRSPVFADCLDMGMSHSFAIEGVKP